MDKQQARNFIEETFEQSFNKTRFTAFIKNLLNRIEEAAFTYQGRYIPDAYKPYISTLERIGKYSDGEHKIDILVIRLKKETSLERARTMQRNFVAWYLNGSRGGELKDAALVADSDCHENLARLKLGRQRVGPLQVVGPDACDQAVGALIGEPGSLFIGRERNDGQYRAENLFLCDTGCVAHAVQQRRFDEVTALTLG